MKFSQNGIDKLKAWEGCELMPYNDQTGLEITSWCRGATIGIGHLITIDEWKSYKDGITQEQAYSLLLKDIQSTVDEVNRDILGDINQNQFDALCILTFNIGPSPFRESSVLKWLNFNGAGASYPSLEQSWKAWNKSQGKEMAGLVVRRQREWELYTTPT